MKVIDLLNKIANGEEVPKKIRITDIDDRITKHYNFFYDEDDQEYKDDELFPLGARLILDRVLNIKVEILGEEHKIPEKINWKEKESMAGYLTKDKQIEVIAKRTEHLKKSINEILDYLEVTEKQKRNKIIKEKR